MLVSDYNYDLPEDRIAKFPPEERGSTRLLVLDRNTGDIQDSHYRDLANFLNPGDVLILNDTRVMRSRLFCELPDGRKRELVVLERHGDEPQRVMYRGKLHEGDSLTIKNTKSAEHHDYLLQEEGNLAPKDNHSEQIIIKKILGGGIAEVDSALPLADLAEKYGTVPLPPYLHRDATESDKKRYQTVWAKHMGSAAAPTASLNMTEELLQKLRDKGVIIKYLTLHVGLGTFLPIRSDQIEDHKMHSEWFHIPDDTIEAINAVRRENLQHMVADDELESSRRVTALERDPRPQPCEDGGGEAGRTRRNSNPRRVVALGTTVARTLEYYGKTGKTSGEDDIFIYPGFDFQIIDALLTNFHAPKSTVLMLASAFAGWEHLKAAYDHAIEKKYDFLSYGDSMLIC